MRYISELDYYGIVNNKKLKSYRLYQSMLATSNSIYSTTLNSPCTMILGIKRNHGNSPKAIIRRVKR